VRFLAVRPTLNLSSAREERKEKNQLMKMQAYPWNDTTSVNPRQQDSNSLLLQYSKLSEKDCI
jgi:hypothetical protein